MADSLLQDLESIRDQLHAMSHQAPTNWCDVAANLQAQVQALIDRQRATEPGVTNGYTLANVTPPRDLRTQLPMERRQ